MPFTCLEPNSPEYLAWVTEEVDYYIIVKMHLHVYNLKRISKRRQRAISTFHKLDIYYIGKGHTRFTQWPNCYHFGRFKVMVIGPTTMLIVMRCAGTLLHSLLLTCLRQTIKLHWREETPVIVILLTWWLPLTIWSGASPALMWRNRCLWGVSCSIGWWQCGRPFVCTRR